MTLALDISTDFAQITDWLKPVKVGATMVNSALRRAISTKEAAASGGRYKVSDVTFHLDKAELPSGPSIGMQILDADGTWTILETIYETLANRWRCICRQLNIDSASKVTIQRATYAKGTTGATEPTWTTLASNVSARVQLQSTDIEADRSNRTAVTEAMVWFAAQQDLRSSDRIVSGSTTLKVKSWDGFDSIEQLFKATCEVSIWPLS
jgi:head-tail adaptor